MSSFCAEIETKFDDLEVPVAELAPEKLVDDVGGFIEAVFGEGVVDGPQVSLRHSVNPDGFNWEFQLAPTQCLNIEYLSSLTGNDPC